MGRYRTVLFDLDGTLTDPGEGITNSVAYALERYGIPVPERSALYKFIGPPLIDSFERFYGFSHADAVNAVQVYREYFRERGIFENVVYPGTTPMLRRLGGAGLRLIVATSKPEVFAKRILQHFELSEYFDFVAGSVMDGERTAKDEVIAYALASAGVTGVSSAVMVGDREHDILGAKKNGLASVGVLYGYGSRSELEAAGADYIAETAAEVCDILL